MVISISRSVNLARFTISEASKLPAREILTLSDFELQEKFPIGKSLKGELRQEEHGRAGNRIQWHYRNDRTERCKQPGL
jgi:hypothetical protein